jgi:autotransporter passenger strand-loop-strand repeat protein
MTTYTIQYNAEGNEWYLPYSGGPELVPVNYPGPVIGPFTSASYLGPSYEDLVYTSGIGAGDTATGVLYSPNYALYGETADFYVDAGGFSSNLTIESGGVEILSGTDSNSYITTGGVQQIEAGGQAFYTIIDGDGSEFSNQSGSQIVSSGGVATSATINSGGAQYVSAGGETIGATVNSGGYLEVDAGTAFDITVASGGDLTLFSGFIADSITISEATFLDTVSGMDLVGYTIGSGADWNIESGAAAANLTIDQYGVLYIYAGGSATNTTINGLEEDEGTVSGTVIENGGSEVVVGTTSNTEIVGGGTQQVGGGGIAFGTTLDGGLQDVTETGSAIGTIVNNGGEQLVEAAGYGSQEYVSGTIVNNGGTQEISGTAINTIVNSGGLQIVEPNGAGAGIANGTIIYSGGREIVEANADASGTIIDGGTLETSFGNPGAITFGGTGGTLQIDEGYLDFAVIGGFAVGDKIDLVSVAYDNTGSATLLSGGVLEIVEGGQTYDLQFTPDVSSSFTLSNDGSGGTDVTLASTLFTSGTDIVDFNALTGAQQAAIAGGADLYHGLGGNDVVTLPTVANYNESIGNNATLGWNPAQTFYTGSLAGDTYQVTGEDGNYNIALGAGSDNVTITGNGGSTIFGGPGTGTVSINGDGNNFVAGGAGTMSVNITGDGNNTVTLGTGDDVVVISGTGDNTIEDSLGSAGVTITNFDGDVTDETASANQALALRTALTSAFDQSSGQQVQTASQNQTSIAGVMDISQVSTGDPVIGSSGQLILSAAFNGPIAFSSAAGGILTIDPGISVNNTISGFEAGDTIDFVNQPNLTTTAVFGSPGEFEVYSGTNEIATLNLGSDSIAYALVPQADGNGGTEIVFESVQVGPQQLNPAGTQINWSDIQQNEGFELAPYVPTNSSGVTVGYGVDLAHLWTPSYFVTNVFPNYASDPDLAFIYGAISNKLVGAPARGYLAEVSGETVTIDNNPASQYVSLTTYDADQLTYAAELYKLSAAPGTGSLIGFWNKYGAGSFYNLPGLAQTALYDLFYNGLITSNSQIMAGFKTAAATISSTSPLGSSSAWENLAVTLWNAGGSNASRKVSDGNLIDQLATQIGGQTGSLNAPILIPVNSTNGTSSQYALAGTALDTVYGLDPNGPGIFTLTEDSASPNFASILLPSDWSGSYLVSYEIGSGWSSPQQAQPLQSVTLPAGVDGLQVTVLDSSGNPVTSQNDFTFFVTFASEGTFNGTVTTPDSVAFDDAATFSSATNVTLTGEVVTAAAVQSAELYNGSTDLGAVTINGDGTWTFSGVLASGTYSDLGIQVTDSTGGTANATAPFTLVAGITGQAYAAEEEDYDSGSNLIGQTYYNADGSVYLAVQITYPDANSSIYSYVGGSALNGLPYSLYEYDYSSGDLVGSQFYYTNITGQSYITGEIDYNGGGQLTRAAFFGVSGQPYSAYEYDYVGGVFAGARYTFTSVPAGASYSSYVVDQSPSNTFAGEQFFFTNVQGQPYTGEEVDFDANVALSRVVLTGVENQAYSSLELDYAGGSYTGYKAYYTGLTGPYSSEEVDVSAANQLQKVVYSGLTATPYSSVEQDYAGGSLADEIYSFTNVTGQPYYAYQVEETPGGSGVQETLDLASGGHDLIALASGQTLTSLGLDMMTGSASGATSFVLNAIYGQDTITNLTAADTVSLPTAEFASFNALLGAAQNQGANVVITAGDGDTLTLNNMTKTQLTGMAANFTFHG